MVLTIHGSDINSITKKKSVKYLCIKWTLMQADQIIAVSTDLKQKIENKFGIQPFKISVIDMGVDTTIFYTNRMLKSRPKDSYNFIFVGRLIPVKGLNILINAISLVVSNSELNLKCAVIGAGENESDYKSMVNEKSLQNHFEFLGLKSQSDIAEIMRNADAVIIPSLEEGFGLVAIEALACGTPVFASNTGGLKSLIKDGKNGYFFPPGDSNALCQLILKFWSGKISLDKTVYTNSNDPYDMNKKVAEIRKIYRGLIHG